MEKIRNQFGMLIGLMHGQKGRLVIFLLTIALFVLSAGAPNAGIGIGKQ